MEPVSHFSLGDTIVSKAPVLTEIPHWSNFFDTRGIRRSVSLFQEFPHQSYPFYFNLTEQHKPTSYSLKKLYIQENDPIEYNFAMKYFGSYSFWQRICETAWFGPFIEEWRLELKAKIESEALQLITRKSKDGDLVAMKYLAEKFTERTKRGRPSKNPVRQQITNDDVLETDFLRITSEDRVN